MYKRIISMITIACLILNMFPVFAKGTTETNTVNTEYFTEDNIIYNVLKNNEEVSLFSGTSSDEITADFDIVLGFDMSVDMYDFDYNGEMKWVEAFKALSEQVPDNTRFAVVIDDNTEFTEELDAKIDDVISFGYNKSNDVISMLDSSLDVFANDLTDRNKIVILTTPYVSDVVELETKMNELLDYGVIPFVFVLSAEINSELENVEFVYQCTNDLDLRLDISDLYLSFAEFNNVMLLSEETLFSEKYTSDFR